MTRASHPGLFVAPRHVMKHNQRTFIVAVATAFTLLALATALAFRSPTTRTSVVDHPVVLQTKAMIYHCVACELVRHCGADCRTVDISEARRLGAKPCTTCGGDCLARQ